MTAPALTLRWSLRDGALPDETCDGVVRVSQLDDDITQGRAQLNANQAQVAQAQATVAESRAQLARTLPRDIAKRAAKCPKALPPCFEGDFADRHVGLA